MQPTAHMSVLGRMSRGLQIPFKILTNRSRVVSPAQ